MKINHNDKENGCQEASQIDYKNVIHIKMENINGYTPPSIDCEY